VGFEVERFDHIVLNCHDVEATASWYGRVLGMRRETFTRSSPDEVRAHLAGCGAEIVAGPVTRTGTLGPMTSHYCRDIEGNLVEIAAYRSPSSGYSPGRLITMASWLLRAMTTSAMVFGSGFSSRCGRYGGIKT